VLLWRGGLGTGNKTGADPDTLSAKAEGSSKTSAVVDTSSGDDMDLRPNY
jgi:hypothetical protein